MIKISERSFSQRFEDSMSSFSSDKREGNRNVKYACKKWQI